MEWGPVAERQGERDSFQALASKGPSPPTLIWLKKHVPTEQIYRLVGNVKYVDVGVPRPVR